MNYATLEPDHRYGYSMEYLKRNLSRDAFDNLENFMRGQTMMLDENFQPVVYPWDFKNWLAGGKMFWD